MSRLRSFAFVLAALVALGCSTLSGSRQEEILARAERVDVALDRAFDATAKDPDRLRAERNLQRLGAMATRLNRVTQVAERAHLSLNATGLDRCEQDLAELERQLGIGPPPEED